MKQKDRPNLRRYAINKKEKMVEQTEKKMIAGAFIPQAMRF
jgi:hypothetical protein